MRTFYERVQGTVELTTIVMFGVVMYSVYKTPNNKFALPGPGADFNSHITSGDYDTTGNNGEAIEQWADSCNFTLIHDAKLQKSFNSGRNTKSHNLDRIYPSRPTASDLCSTHQVILPQPIPFRLCFNFKKADWNGYSA